MSARYVDFAGANRAPTRGHAEVTGLFVVLTLAVLDYDRPVRAKYIPVGAFPPPYVESYTADRRVSTSETAIYTTDRAVCSIRWAIYTAIRAIYSTDRAVCSAKLR